MRRVVTWSLVVALAWGQSLWAQGNSWNKIRYGGGTVPAKVNQYDWNTTLTVTSDAIVLVFAGRQGARIPPAQVTALSYGQEAHRRVADMVALSVLTIIPFPLFGLLHKSKNHFVGIEFRTGDGKPGAVLLEVDKRIYRPILEVLQAVTGKPVTKSP